ncbi:MAG TPA: 50S ribosomal protein L11 methyltransferase [Porphyromonadaceae bacterium]|nr:50S ribosomal protein L11 methyltransferase [Porphyromonadaceae bacterium]
MDYVEVSFFIDSEIDSEIVSDVLASELSPIGFESFVTEGNTLKAYVPVNQFSKENIDQVIAEFPLEATLSYEDKFIKTENWNEEWEKNFFQPIVVGNECVIHSTFHKDIPQTTYEILIDPKMAFGTGHHETTFLMLSQILKMDVEGKRVLDMGCGTAVLGILASMRGAKEIVAIDIDEWAYNNSVENVELNKTPNVEVKLGAAELLAGESFDIIIANINRNILLNDINRYAACMTKGATLYMSGFYTEDIPAIEEECNKYGLQLFTQDSKNNWAVVGFEMK